MTEFYAFVGEHWFLTWCALWLAWGLIFIAYGVVALSYRIVNRLLRTIKVAIRGWPPAHLDADGDWKPVPEKST